MVLRARRIDGVEALRIGLVHSLHPIAELKTAALALAQELAVQPPLAMAAVIGVKHPKWDERPLLFIVRKPGQSVEKQDILNFLAGRVAKWWLPDEVVFLEALPVGGTGKVQKEALRKQYGGVFT